MNIYIMDPTYVRSEAWKSFIDSLKIKSAFSFIPKRKLDKKLCATIKKIKCVYDLDKIAPKNVEALFQCHNNAHKQCAYWLRECLELHSQLQEEVRTASFEDFLGAEDHNCAIFMEFNSRFVGEVLFFDFEDYDSGNKKMVNRLLVLCQPKFKWKWEKLDYDNIDESLLLNEYGQYCYEYDKPMDWIWQNFVNYSLNILRKKHGHSRYQEENVFILFDEFFVQSYSREGYRRWEFTNPAIILDKIASKEENSVLYRKEGKFLENLLSDEGLQIVEEKWSDYIERRKQAIAAQIEEEYYDDYSSSYGRYAGSYAQDVEGWSDEAIDEVFDGDPGAYWNID